MTTTVMLVVLQLFLLIDALIGLTAIKDHEQGLVSRFGRHARVAGPGLHFIVPFVDDVRRIDLRDVAVTVRIDPDRTGRIRIGEEEWEARTDDTVGLGLGTPIRIARVEGQIMVVTAA